MNDVAVLGCGPAGLLAALAAEEAGFNPVIFSIKRPSVIHGAQYLHRSIDSLTDRAPDYSVRFIKRGTRFGYAQKVYGDPQADCSWDNFDNNYVEAWDLGRAYQDLWDRYESRISHSYLNGLTKKVISNGGYVRVISSVPLQVLCEKSDEHSFKFVQMWVRPAEDLAEDNIVVYNGDPITPWYRASKIGGVGYKEFGHPVEGAKVGVKPLWTTCDCHPEMMKVGRFGQWKRGVLVHHAYEETLRALQQL